MLMKWQEEGGINPSNQQNSFNSALEEFGRSFRDIAEQYSEEAELNKGSFCTFS